LKKEILWGDRYTCHIVKYGTLDNSTIDSIQIEYRPSWISFLSGSSVETHEGDQMNCLYPSCSTGNNPKSHDRLREWFETGNAGLKEYKRNDHK